MDKTLLEHFREKLQRRRYVLVDEKHAMSQANAKLREERSAEFEEEIQNDEMITTLETLDASRDEEIAQIDGALARIDAGTYGRCQIDGGSIDPDRLEALPYTRLCTIHASEMAFEKGWRSPDPL